MKRLILFVVMAVFTLNANSQTEYIRGLFDRVEDIYVEGLGAAQLSVTSIKDNTHLLLGGYGGVLLNRKFLSGVYGMALVTNENFTALKEGEEVDARLGMGYGGLYFAYFHKINNPVNFSFPFALGIGGATVREDIPVMNKDTYPSTYIEGATLFVVEPGMNINFNFSKHFILSAGVSYRYAMFDRTLVNVKQEDLSALNINVAFNFGMF